MNASSSSPDLQSRSALCPTKYSSPCKAVCVLALSIFACALAINRRVAAQGPSADTTRATGATRLCASTAAETTPSNNAKHPDTATLNTQVDIAPSCLEIKATALEIQEHLKAIVREKRWTIGQAQTSADSYSFYRLLDRDELTEVAKTEILGGRITWTEGKAFVMARITDAGDGFTRVIVSARIQGRGQTAEHFARPSDLWPLVSKGTLEGGMIAALESRCHSQP
jgi:hypothetical protein